MASSVIQIRIDEDLKNEAAAVFDRLGIDTPTAVRMFMKRAVLENGIPFRMTIPKTELNDSRAIRAMKQLSDEAVENGTADMSLDEINAEIDAVRAERRAQKGER